MLMVMAMPRRLHKKVLKCLIMKKAKLPKVPAHAITQKPDYSPNAHYLKDYMLKASSFKGIFSEFESKLRINLNRPNLPVQGLSFRCCLEVPTI